MSRGVGSGTSGRSEAGLLIIFLIWDKFCVCVLNRVKMQITAASASPPKLKMSWDHEPCETDHVELQSIGLEIWK